jgi:hypothetical protein
MTIKLIKYPSNSLVDSYDKVMQIIKISGIVDIQLLFNLLDKCCVTH